MTKYMGAFFVNGRHPGKPFTDGQIGIFNIKCLALFVYQQGFGRFGIVPS